MAQILNEELLDYSSVLIKPITSNILSRNDVTLERDFGWFNGVPIIAANMAGVGTTQMLTALAEQKCMTALMKHYTIAEVVHALQTNQHFGWYTMGITDYDFGKLCAVIELIPIEKICVDIANGYVSSLPFFIEKVRKLCPNAIIMAGNIVTGDRAIDLENAGVNAIKVGIGGGGVCTTRKVTGVGYPQLSAVLDVVAGVKSALVCADGGCTTPGDVCKAFAAGADFVMLGSMLAGHTESGFEPVDGHIEFFGMSSEHAMNTYIGQKAEYRSSEGKLVRVPFRGEVEKTIKHILGGLRSCCSYTNSKNLVELAQNAIFVKTPAQYNKIFGDE